MKAGLGRPGDRTGDRRAVPIPLTLWRAACRQADDRKIVRPLRKEGFRQTQESMVTVLLQWDVPASQIR